MKKNQSAEKQLKSLGFKITPSRLAILEAFSERCHPLSAEDIHKKLKKEGVDLVTVYRTLISFEKEGILRKVNLQKNKKQFYELNQNHHHHITCTTCGLTEELDWCNIDKATLKITSKSDNFKMINSHSLEFFGLCNKCSL